jgi:hypothetical protein
MICTHPERQAQLRAEALALACPGAMAEFGVWRGGTAALLADATDRDLHLFDTFTGIPASAVDGHDTHRAGDFCDTNLEDVRALLAPYGERIHWHIGEFDPADVPDIPFALVHIDADTYLSYKAALPRFWSLLAPGGVVLLDDYAAPTCPGATLATNEFIVACSPPPSVTYFPGYGAMLKKTAEES